MKNLLSLIILTTLLTQINFAQLSWTKHGTPVILPGSAGEWDGGGYAGQSVIFDGTTYKMWYGGTDGSTFRIGYATSLEGINWTKYNNPSTTNPPYAESDPVLNIGPESWENKWVYFPFVYFDGIIYRMWYVGTNGNSDRVGYATSSDGITWSKYGTPVIDLGLSGSWDDAAVGPGPISFDGTKFHMLYNGFDGLHFQGGYASSTDGINWDKSANPILVYGAAGSWDTPRVQPSSVVYNQNTSKYYLFYSGGEFLNWRIGYATSSKLNGPYVKNSSIMLDVTPGSFDSDVIAFPCTIYDSTSNQYKMWYLGGSSTVPGAIGYATADMEVIDTVNIPNDYATIQEGINAAENGNIVLVNEGTYYENINFKRKAITVASKFILDQDTSHISNTIINGSQPSNPNNASVVTFNSGEDTTSVICGFTITGGNGTILNIDGSNYRLSGGILAHNSDAKIINNIIEFNQINSSNSSWGGGIGAYSADKSGKYIIENNIIRYNSINTPTSPLFSLGGGIYTGTRGYVRIAFNKILYNSITAPEAYGGGIEPAGGENDSYYIHNNLIKGNRLNSSAGGSGGIDIYMHAPIVRNNIIVYNYAPNGGAMYIETTPATSLKKLDFRSLRSNDDLAKISADDIPHFENNTILNNTATKKGGGLYIYGKKPEIVNCIIWGNLASTDSQISGAANISYSDIEGGNSGTGNIDLDPLLADTVNYYLNTNSPCIDAGNPDSAYFDIEDLTNPGYAMFPALGTIRNDIGAYGGHPFVKVEAPKELLGAKFREFVNRVNSTIGITKQAVVDSFMTTVSSFPYIEEDTIVYFIYKGTAQTIGVPSDANNWAFGTSPMTKLEGTNFWYYETVYELDARLDYKFVLNGIDWILDPLNPNKVNGGYGPNSEIAMPQYIQPPEIEYYDNISHGLIQSFLYTSTILNNTRRIYVYTPPNYESQSTEHFPLILLHDGSEYISLGYAVNILDYLIANNKIEPIICVFVPPVDRDNEYALSKTQEFESFIVDELMPNIDSTYRTISNPQKRGMGGLSSGGLITTQICFNHPENFGLSAPFSPSYWANSMKVFNSVVYGDIKNIKWYLDWGTYEPSIMQDGHKLKDALVNKGNEVIWKQWHEGHSWGSWRAHLDEALLYFFPTDPNDVKHEKELPNKFALSQNYPNPFNPLTKIKYQIPEQVRNDNSSGLALIRLNVFDILGREVTTLVNQKQNPGNYKVTWDGNNLSSGVYFYQLTAGDFVETKRMILLK